RRAGQHDGQAARAVRRGARDRGAREHREDPHRWAHLLHDPLRAPPHAVLPPDPVRRPLGHRELRPVPERARRSRGRGEREVSTNYAANPRDLPRGLVFACVMLIGIGVIAFAAGLMRDEATAWRAFHVNFLYYGNMSLGALCLACALVIID